MRKIILTLVFIIVYPVFCLSDTSLVNHQNSLSEKFMEEKMMDSVYFYAYNALLNSTQINYAEGKARAEFNLGVYYHKKSHFNKSITHLISAREQYLALNDLNGILLCETQIGLIHYLQKKYNEAYKYFQNSLKYIMADSPQKPAGMLHYLSGLSLIETGNFDKSESHLLKALEIYSGLSNDKKIIECKVGLADLYTRKSELTKGVALYNEALSWFYSIGNENHGLSICYLGLGTIEMKQGEIDAAIVYAQKAFTLADSAQFYLVAEKSAKLLADMYFKRGDFENAFKFQNKYFDIRDSIMSADNLKAIYNIESELALLKKQSEVELLNKQRQVDKLMLYSSLGGGFFLFLFSLGLYHRFRTVRKTKDIINREKQHSDQLLLNILPEETAQELKKYGKAKAMHYNEVTVLFADIKGFTTHAENLAPETLVSIIDKYFQGFDEICEKFGIEKIKTIGDAYLCAGGLPNPEKGKPEEVVAAALEMQQYVNRLHEEKDIDEPAFEIRIGIHTGPIVAGVVGSKKFAYDIWGDTVNTAARMEQNSMPGQINISQYTYNKVKNGFNCTYRGKMPAKNKGEIEMYFVQSKKNHVHLPNIILGRMNIVEAENYISEKLKKELKPELYYHGFHHTLDVLNSVEELARTENVKGEDFDLLRIAALYHDSGFIKSYTDHEEHGVELAKESLPDFGFNMLQIEKICGMIRATRIPHQPKNHLEEILADADLDYLGREDFEHIANSLYREFLHHGIVKDEKEWNRLQVSFFEKHRYFTRTANEKRNALKSKHLFQLKSIVAGYDEITAG